MIELIGNIVGEWLFEINGTLQKRLTVRRLLWEKNARERLRISARTQGTQSRVTS